MRLAGAYCGCIAVYELFGGEDNGRATLAVSLMANSVKEMCLAKARKATE